MMDAEPMCLSFICGTDRTVSRTSRGQLGIVLVINGGLAASCGWFVVEEQALWSWQGILMIVFGLVMLGTIWALLWQWFPHSRVVVDVQGRSLLFEHVRFARELSSIKPRKRLLMPFADVHHVAGNRALRKDLQITIDTTYGRATLTGMTNLGRLLSVLESEISHNRCAECGYNLTGNRSGVCPECGVEVHPI